jgi:hypothetical protein
LTRTPYFTRPLFIALTLIAIASPPGGVSGEGQSIRYVDANFPANTELRGAPPPNALDLLDSRGNTAGKVGIQQWKDSIVIWGRFKTNDAAPQWARSPLELSSRTHVDLWFSAVDSVPMPDIEWGNQFGYESCGESPAGLSASVDKCAAWQSRQVLYRDQLRRLFIRKWQLAPDVSTEGFATEAYRQTIQFADKMDPNAPVTFSAEYELSKLKPLEPQGSPALTSWNGDAFTGFQIVVPRSTFPPASSLDLTQIRVVVEVAEGARVVASTSPKRKDNAPSTFTSVSLGRAITSKIGSCGAPLEIALPYEVPKERPAWYFPTANGIVSDFFILANQRVGYRRAPDGLSPLPAWSHHFERELGNGDVVCGPALRLKTPGKVWTQGSIDDRHLSTLKLPDGSFLLKSGPTMTSYSPFGSGRCGACPVASVQIYHLSRSTGITTAFTSGIRIDGPVDGSEEDGDIQVSPDWNTVTVFERKRRTEKLEWTWSSRKYCLSGRRYVECGAGPQGPPPEPRQVDFRS